MASSNIDWDVNWYLDGKLVHTSNPGEETYAEDGPSVISISGSTVKIGDSNHTESYDYGKEIKHAITKVDFGTSPASVYALTIMEGQWLLNEIVNFSDIVDEGINGIYAYFPLHSDETNFTLEGVNKIESSTSYKHLRIYSNSYSTDLGTQTSYNTLSLITGGTVSSYLEVEATSGFYPGYETRDRSLSSETGIKLRTLIFETNYSCSDKFAVWLSNNATKVEEEKVSCVGKWRLNETITPISTQTTFSVDVALDDTSIIFDTLILGEESNIGKELVNTKTGPLDDKTSYSVFSLYKDAEAPFKGFDLYAYYSTNEVGSTNGKIAYISSDYVDEVNTTETLRTIEITGGDDASNETLYNWLVTNAVKIEPRITRYYKNSKPISVDGKTCKFRHYSKNKPVVSDEFVGTWVLNNPLTYVDNTFNNQTLVGLYGYTYDGNTIDLYEFNSVTLGKSQFYITFTNNKYSRIVLIKENRYYTDSNNVTYNLDDTYVSSNFGADNVVKLFSSDDGIKLRTIIISENYSCSNEFKSWLMANATKQEGGITNYTLSATETAIELGYTFKVDGEEVSLPYTLTKDCTIEITNTNSNYIINDTLYYSDNSPITISAQDIVVDDNDEPSDDYEHTLTINFKVKQTTKNLISFSIQVDGSSSDVLSLEAEEGMTWEEWVNSSYNNLPTPLGTITKILIEDDYPKCSISGGSWNRPIYYDSSQKKQISADDVIESGHAYYITTACCFDAGTQVLMSDDTTKNIEDVEIGDEVVSYNIETKKFENKKVLNTIINKHSTDLVELKFSDGTTIRMRAYHPLLTIDGYKSLRQHNGLPLLEIGDKLITKDGLTELLLITPIVILTTNYSTYNLSVKDNHNYVVNGIVAHNADCDSNA